MPAQMLQAHPAMGIFPDSITKPGKFCFPPSLNVTPLGLLETTNFIDNSGRIEKGMPKGGVNLDLVMMEGNQVPAFPA